MKAFLKVIFVCYTFLLIISVPRYVYAQTFKRPIDGIDDDAYEEDNSGGGGGRGPLQTFRGSLYGIDEDVFIINTDETAFNAGLRLQTKHRDVYRDWSIWNNKWNGNLSFSYLAKNTHSTADERYAGTDMMTLSRSGRLGIGTTIPKNTLHVNGGIDINDYIRHTGHIDTYFGFSAPDQFQITTNGINRMMVLPDGKVGIGTGLPAYRLHVKEDIYADGGWFRVNGNNGIYFQKWGGGLHMTDNTWIRTYGNKSFYHNAGIMRTDGTFQVGLNGDRFLVKPDGKVGIGTATPAEKLDVAGDIHTSTGEINSKTGAISLMKGIRNDDNTYEWTGFFSGTKRQGIILYDGPWAGANNSTDEFSITAENGNKLTLNTDGDHIALMPKGNGYIGLGTLTPVYPLHVMKNKMGGWQAKFENGSSSVSLANELGYGMQINTGKPNSDTSADRYALEVKNSDQTHFYIQDDGNIGIGTTSPDHRLSVIGKLSLANTEDETKEYMRLYHDGQANITTAEGALHFRKNAKKYLTLSSAPDKPGTTLIDASGQNLVFKAFEDGSGDMTIRDDGTVVVHKGFELEGGLFLSNVNPGNEDEYVLSYNDGQLIHKRSVASLTPWVIRQVYQDSDTINVISSSPHAEGEVCTCEPDTHITIDAGSVIDIEGNLALGLQGIIDNDEMAGADIDEGTGTRTLLDDFIRIQEHIEVSSSSGTKGLVLLDNKVASGNFLNFYQDGNISYLSNSTNSTPQADYFMEAGTGVDAEKNYVSFSGLVNFNSGFITSGYTSPDKMNFAMDTDNTGEDALFQVGRGTKNPDDETNWYGLFSVDKDGLATFSSDIGDTGNPNRILVNGATGGVFLTGTLGVGSSESTPKIALNGVSGNISTTGSMNIGGHATFSLSADFLQEANITGNLNVLGNSNIVTGSYGSAFEWKMAYDSRMAANEGLTWNPVTKSLDVKLGDALHIDVDGKIASDFTEIAPQKLSYSGSLAIGTAKHSTFALSVGGIVGAEEVIIQNQEEWPDYVFEKDYQLKSLQETAHYISENKHLPEVPSAQEISENGIQIGQMNAILLKKIEELTLHLITKDKEIARLMEENKRIDAIDKRLSQLENK